MELAFSEVVLPFTHRFKPDIILVSAGYDAHVEDPFQLLQYTNRTYHYIAQNIKKLAEDVCKGRLVFLLEGTDQRERSIHQRLHRLETMMYCAIELEGRYHLERHTLSDVEHMFGQKLLCPILFFSALTLQTVFEWIIAGGYNPTALGEAVTATWMGLLDDGAADSKQILNKKYKLEPEPFHEVQTMIAQLKRLLQL